MATRILQAAVVALLLVSAGGALLPPPAAQETAAGYSAPQILRPGSGETVHDNTGAVPVRVELQPPLRSKEGHRLRVLLDGALLPGAWSTNRFALPDIDRGTHTLKVVVTDRDGRQLAESETIEFHLWRASKLLPSRRKAP